MKWLPCISILLLLSCTMQRRTETNLYFGLSKPAGGMVTVTEWNQFRDKYINKTFKEGCTIMDVTGHWFDPEKKMLITEPAYKVIYFYKRTSVISKEIDSLRYWYKFLFQQQSVLRVDRKVNTSF